MGTSKGNGPATIDECLGYLFGKDWGNKQSHLAWPPDVFAAAATLLQKSGAYINIVEEWPPKGVRDWEKSINRIGKNWRAAAAKKRWKCPKSINNWWKCLVTNAALPIHLIGKKPAVWRALVYLSCAADASCEGIGIYGESIWTDEFLMEGILHLHQCVRNKSPSTLCKLIHPTKLVVLPKVHTPQKGITLRSISHNLSLTESSDISINWLFGNRVLARSLDPETQHSSVILIIPEPSKLSPSQFKQSRPPHGRLTQMSGDDFGFFQFVPETSSGILPRFDDLYRRTISSVGRVDGVILPEMALTPFQYKALRSHILSKYPSVSFLCSGVYSAPTRRYAGSNYAAIWRRIGGNIFLDAKQHKHHRWFLDESQICQYGMGSMLDPTKKWWENISIKKRELNFLALESWLTACVLICEDLARPDPVGHSIRAVGPNLVIALLQDGPQLSHRWSARCATTLTDDPGCSVLTVTSIGMAALSQPPSDLVGHVAPSRTIAHWKDRETGTKQICLPDKKEAVVLCLSRKQEKEWTADGRKSNRAALVKLAGIHYV